jgi:hypothetical protein
LGGAYTHVFRANRSTFDQKTENVVFGPGENLSEINKYGYLGTYRFATPVFCRQALAEWTCGEELESFTPRGAFVDGLERNRSNVATVGEYRGEFFDNLSVTGAVRRDDNDKFRDFTTWRASASLMLKSVGLRRMPASDGSGAARHVRAVRSRAADVRRQPQSAARGVTRLGCGRRTHPDTQPRLPGSHLFPDEPDKRDHWLWQFFDQPGRREQA